MNNRMNNRIARLCGAILLLLGIGGAIAATYTAPAPQGSRPDRTTNRYATPVEGLLRIAVSTANVDDGVTLVDEADLYGDRFLSGYLLRVVWSSDGNDTDGTLSITDADGVTLFTKSGWSMAADPYSYIVTEESAAGDDYAGVPFIGGLNVVLADCNDGDGNDVDVVLYVKESWRR